MTSDPVQLGLVASMARPGGNITGVSVDAGLELWEKRLQLFREVSQQYRNWEFWVYKKTRKQP
jgi:putative ABC transport system substrate-binding protein